MHYDGPDVGVAGSPGHGYGYDVRTSGQSSRDQAATGDQPMQTVQVVA